MNDVLFPRAELLIQQNRFDEAGKVLSQILASDPNNIFALAMFAEVKLQTGELDEADDLLNKAITLAPDDDVLYYYKARVSMLKDKYDNAEKHLNDAIALDPGSPSYFSLLANIKLQRKQYQTALDLSEQALALDPEEILALNVRSSALLKLNRKQEAYEAIEGALSEDPNNAYTHANYGWGLLETGDPKKALEHFREALRNDPDSHYAQAGMAEALKARYAVYRLFLKYSFWINKFTAKYQWMFIIGFYMLTRSLNALSENNSGLRPYLQPLILLMAIFAFSTWIITPLSNLFLRLNPYGKHLLDKKEKLSSNFTGISFLVFIGGLIPYLAGAGEAWMALTVFGFTMMVPCSVMFSPAKYKNALVIYAAIMGLLGIAAVSIAFSMGIMLNLFATIYLFGFIAFQWIANFTVIKEGNR